MADISKIHQAKDLYEFSGLWNEEMYIKDLTVSFVPGPFIVTYLELMYDLD